MRLRLLSLLSTSLLSILLPHTFAQQAQDSRKIPVGNYLINGCSAILPSTHDTKTALLTSLLREIDADLPTLIVEANTGTDSNYGFISLFTSNDAIEPVTATYGKISDGATVVLSNGVGEKQVTFQCLEKDDPVTGPFLAQLEAEQPRGAAFSAFGQETIYLLPFFFTDLLRSPAPYRCPLFRKGRITINGDDVLGASRARCLRGQDASQHTISVLTWSSMQDPRSMGLSFTNSSISICISTGWISRSDTTCETLLEINGMKQGRCRMQRTMIFSLPVSRHSCYFHRQMFSRGEID